MKFFICNANCRKKCDASLNLSMTKLRFIFYFMKEINNIIIVVLVSLKYLKNQENTDKTCNSLQCDSSEAQQFQGSKEFLSV